MADETVSLEEYWNDAATAIKEALGESDYATWFSRVHYDSSSEDVLRLKASSTYVLETVSARYSDIITQKVSECAGFPVRIEFTLKKSEPSPKKEPRKEEQSPVLAPAQTPSKKEGRARGSEMLNPAYTFDSFVPGENSLFPFSACRAIAENPGGSYNPCLIYGGVGLGKTHLLQAIGNQIVQNSKLKVLYVTSENFVNEYINAVNTKTTVQFKNKYRRTNVLLMDDIQFLENKDQSQTELFNAFNDLYDSGRQLVFTSDRPVSELKNITERLRNRFARGLNVDIQPPEYETRMAILRRKAQEKNFHMEEDVLDYVAQNVKSNVRDLEACLTRLVAYSELIGRPVTLEVAREQLKNSISVSIDRSTASVANIIKCVAEFYGISPYDIKGKSKKKSIAGARQIAMYLARKQTDFSTTEIGTEFGGRDHTTIMYAIQKVESALTVPNSETQAVINRIMTIIKAGDRQ